MILILSLYKSVGKSGLNVNIPNKRVCINRESFNKTLSIDMHISQINPPVYKDNQIISFRTWFLTKNKSIKYFNQYSEKFYHCLFRDFKNLKEIY